MGCIERCHPLLSTPTEHLPILPRRSDKGGSIPDSAAPPNRSTFQGNMADAGRVWWEYMQHTASAYTTDYGINFANVASHNHFSLGRGGVVFNAHAPVIKLPAPAVETDYLGLLAVLNSSVACFLIRANSQPKGGAANITWSRTFEITGGTIAELPLPAALPTSRGAALQELADAQLATSPDAVVAREALTRDELDVAREEWHAIRRQMVSHQEELDWEVYGLFGLLDEDLCYHGEDLPDLSPGERAFELFMAQKLDEPGADRSWFERLGIVPCTELPAAWPKPYAELVRRRVEVIASLPALAVLEAAENKRRWAHDGWAKLEERAARRWILDALERADFWFDRHGRPTPTSLAVLADEVSRDEKLVAALSVWTGQKDVDVAGALGKLVEPESVPYLAALRNRESGLRKREAWAATWDAQRRVDAGSDGSQSGALAVPPEFKEVDFVRSEYWRLRGKYDQPNERFVAYPAAGREGDTSMVVGWAGWNHAQHALAVATL
ncbi:BREX-2 system adenine-specific DNA-methyltransferase PglX [Nocardioides aequoreus]|uniref:BREX-2 system adenine-specific DNA-methyltransferase PglX n=1 Tax=Nocardioides aequoreus TaxID=397278 RepID=UPI002480D2B1|nr:BREX-2 system adenine-specific DNA-methyltransferase PglX [Nocardioides aequoreus]